MPRTEMRGYKSASELETKLNFLPWVSSVLSSGRAVLFVAGGVVDGDESGMMIGPVPPPLISWNAFRDKNRRIYQGRHQISHGLLILRRWHVAPHSQAQAC